MLNRLRESKVWELRTFSCLQMPNLLRNRAGRIATYFQNIQIVMLHALAGNYGLLAML